VREKPSISEGIAMNKKVWIDLDNSPHVLFFKPLIKILENKNFSTIVTVRDYAQVVGLTEIYNIKCKIIGKHYGKNKFMKSFGLIYRAMQLLPAIYKEKPDIAFSHYSRSQLLAAKILRIPTIVAYDYEYVQNLIFIHPTLYLVPEVVYKNLVKLKNCRYVYYPGLKENVYMNNSPVDNSIVKQLEIEKSDVVVTVRPPATEAHYHNQKSSRLFEFVINYLVQNSKTKLIMLPRTKAQEKMIRKKWAPTIIENKMKIPQKVLNGSDIVKISDMVISGGGTMIREAAAVGVPAYSIFCGKLGAVDNALVTRGKLNMIMSENDVQKKLVCIKKRELKIYKTKENPTIDSIVGHVERAVKKK
jgi:uncharacterized protein